MPQRFDVNGYARDDIRDTDDVQKRTPINVRQVALKSDPAIKVLVDDRTFDPAVHEELPCATA